ncbi:hypothetical protein KP509_13G013700 [Ceratopteris richardii]|uniref:RING-type E3 ubiquitin transferase n=1 Tax=Ceratopteris richardii TaxID=49495 RepID=A0A8T2TDH2_CERRI|nr:hypothetical protein KP509_13G013700 [Ceratopteris richardii]
MHHRSSPASRIVVIRLLTTIDSPVVLASVVVCALIIASAAAEGDPLRDTEFWAAVAASPPLPLASSSDCSVEDTDFRFPRRSLYVHGEAPTPGTSEAQQRQYREAAIIYVAAATLCMVASALAYCIAHKLVKFRSDASSTTGGVRTSNNPAWLARGWEYHNDSDEEVSDGLDASLVATFPVVPYHSAVAKLALASGEESFVAPTKEGSDAAPMLDGQDNTVEKKVQIRSLSLSAVKECAVCLSDFMDCEEVKILPVCGHCFHVECIDMWLFSNTTCPVCRFCLKQLAIANTPSPPHQQLYGSFTPTSCTRLLVLPQ